MIKLNRTTEYGLIALRHISRKHFADPAGVTSAREVSDTYGLPFEITAKTLLRLKDSGLIQSAQGARGGYTLNRDLGSVTLADFLQVMEGPQSVVACASLDGALAPNAEKKPEKKAGGKDCECEYSRKCEIRGVMSDLNKRVFDFLAGIRLAELVMQPTSAQSTALFSVAPLLATGAATEGWAATEGRAAMGGGAPERF